jgi:anaerobic selenocysteine-containing dehydrogenase
MASAGAWKSTGCILCSINCGLQVQVEDGHLVKIKGDKSNPRSRGYTCEKPSRLDHYQNHADRVTIFYYGGGGQGNHLGGAYSAATRRALGMRYASNALAQEKTGEFWVERQMFGARPEPDFENAEVSVFVGKNPWHSHGFERARVVLRDIAKDPFCLSALLAVLVEEGFVDEAFLSEHAGEGRALFDALAAVPIADYCARAGVDETLVREAARRIGRAASVAVVEDLGIEMAPHSTLNSYLEKLLYVLTGNFGRPGTMNLGTHLGKLTGSSRDDRRSPVGGHLIITGLIPCNAIPDEILTDHPDRFRAMLIESGNPVHSLADSPRMREALDALELVVVIDVAMTETAHHADYILPGASQYEKVESTFFGGGFPNHVFQLRQPVLEPAQGTLPEPEIHSRLCRALSAWTDDDLVELREAAAESREKFGLVFMQTLGARPDLAGIAPVVLYETLGRSLGKGRESAALVWGAAQQLAASDGDSVRRAGFVGEGAALGDALFPGTAASSW